MTKEDKELLLKDFSARLPYGVLCHINGDDTNTPRKLSRIEVDELDGILLDFWTDREDSLSIQVYLSEVKPYLRPMSSMTEGERTWYKSLLNGNIGESILRSINRLIDWLKANHFDYRGLIEKGLAIEAPKDMYETE